MNHLMKYQTSKRAQLRVVLNLNLVQLRFKTMENLNSMAEKDSKNYEVSENLLVEENLKVNKEKLLETENVLKKTEDKCGNSEEVVEETIEPTQVPTLFHILQAPKLCPAGYKLDHQGRCRKII